LIGDVSIVDVGDEPLHVPIAGTRASTLDPEPPIRVVTFVVLTHFSGVLDHHLRPDLSGAQVDATTAMDGVALEHHRQLLEVDRQGPQEPGGPRAQTCPKRVSQLLVPLPAARSQGRHTLTGKACGFLDLLSKDDHEAVADQLQRVIRPPPGPQLLDEGDAVAASNRPS